MTGDRYPVKDGVAIVGVASTTYSRDSGRSPGALVLEACAAALKDAGVTVAEVDGLCGTNRAPAAGYVQGGLGIPSAAWWVNPAVPFQHQIMEAMNAIYAGACTTVLAYQGTYRSSGVSRSAAADPFRARFGPGLNVLSPNIDSLASPVGHAAWAARYLHEAGVGREVFGKMAINNRSHASRNEHAAMRAPLTMDDYLGARPIREPLSMLDMDYPVDGADAFVLTTAERARDLRQPAVIIHAAAMGQTDRPVEDQTPDLRTTGQQVAANLLWRRSDIALADVDIFFPYDGFSNLAVRWCEVVGYCGDGEANSFFDDNWDHQAACLSINGRVSVDTHGGSLSDGGTQGAGHFREAVLQLRGGAGSHQISGVKTALITQGGMFFNAGVAILRTA